MPEDLSFLPEDYRERQAARRTNLLLLGLFVLVLGGTGGYAWHTSRKQERVQHELQVVNHRFDQAAQRLEQMDQLQDRRRRMIDKARTTSKLIERVPRTLILSQLTNLMPRTLSLREMKLQTRRPRRSPRPRTALQRSAGQASDGRDPAPPPLETTIGLVGYAPTDVEVSSYTAALRAHPVFDHVNLQYSKQVRVNKQQVREFAVRLKLAPEINVRSLAPDQIERKLKHNPMSDEAHFQGARESHPS